MSRSWGLAAIDLTFIRDRIIPYVFRRDDSNKPALLAGLDTATTERRLAVEAALQAQLPAEVIESDYSNPRRSAWSDAAAFGGEFARPLLLLQPSTNHADVHERMAAYLASDAQTCLDVLDREFATAFPDWHRECGHPSTWQPTPWHNGPRYPSPVTAGLDLLRDIWLAKKSGAATFQLPANASPDDDDNQSAGDDVHDYLDAHAMSLMIGYAIAHTPLAWAGGGWVTPTGMLQHFNVKAPEFQSPRDIFAQHIPAGVLKAEQEAHYNKGTLTDDTACVLGALILPENVGQARRRLHDLRRIMNDPGDSAAAATRHLGGAAAITNLIGSLFGKKPAPAKSSAEAIEWAQGFAAESENTLLFFDEVFATAEALGLAVVETSGSGIEWPVGVAEPIPDNDDTTE